MTSTSGAYIQERSYLRIYVLKNLMLLSQAMPNLEDRARNQLSGLPTSVSKQLCATGEATELDKVVERARPLIIMEEREHTAVAAVTKRETAIAATSDRASCSINHMQELHPSSSIPKLPSTMF
jgi:hypothetical protein